MKQMIFNDGHVDMVNKGRNDGEESTVSIRNGVLEQAYNLGLLSKVKETERNIYYSDNTGKNITFIVCIPKEKSEYLPTCIVDTYINGTHVKDILGDKAIRLHRKTTSRKDFRVSIRTTINKNECRQINVGKLLNYYAINKIESTTENIDIQGEELHHKGILADNRLNSTILFKSRKQHRDYHSKYGESSHKAICEIENTDNLKDFLEYISTTEYDKYMDSFIIRNA